MATLKYTKEKGSLYEKVTNSIYTAIIAGALGLYSLAGCATTQSQRKKVDNNNLENRVEKIEEFNSVIIEVKDEQGKTIRIIACGPKIKSDKK